MKALVITKAGIVKNFAIEISSVGFENKVKVANITNSRNTADNPEIIPQKIDSI
jgi:hypothetical protein